MEKDTFDQIKRDSKKGNLEHEYNVDISPTGYGYVPAESNNRKELKEESN